LVGIIKAVIYGFRCEDRIAGRYRIEKSALLMVVFRFDGVVME